jgi:hypothetical protein
MRLTAIMVCLIIIAINTKDAIGILDGGINKLAKAQAVECAKARTSKDILEEANR